MATGRLPFEVFRDCPIGLRTGPALTGRDYTSHLAWERASGSPRRNRKAHPALPGCCHRNTLTSSKWKKMDGQTDRW